MDTDFNAVQHHLAKALTYLVGRDEATARFRQALDLLVEAAIANEHRRPDPKVVPFRARQDRR
jgi:hypothetical protein